MKDFLKESTKCPNMSSAKTVYICVLKGHDGWKLPRLLSQVRSCSTTPDVWWLGTSAVPVVMVCGQPLSLMVYTSSYKRFILAVSMQKHLQPPAPSHPSAPDSSSSLSSHIHNPAGPWRHSHSRWIKVSCTMEDKYASTLHPLVDYGAGLFLAIVGKWAEFYVG